MEAKIKYIKPDCYVVEMDAYCLMAGTTVNLPTNGGTSDEEGELPYKIRPKWDDEE